MNATRRGTIYSCPLGLSYPPLQRRSLGRHPSLALTATVTSTSSAFPSCANHLQRGLQLQLPDHLLQLLIRRVPLRLGIPNLLPQRL